jgi:hypothetical protein
MRVSCCSHAWISQPVHLTVPSRPSFSSWILAWSVGLPHHTVRFEHGSVHELYSNSLSVPTQMMTSLERCADMK